MSPPITGSIRRQGNRREQVLEAARELFFANGYRGTTVEQIARRAGYSKRTVYLDYRNKDELFITVCAQGGELLFEHLKQIPQEEIPIETAISLITRAYISFFRDHSEYYRMIFSEATPEMIENCSEQLRARVASIEQACLGVVVAWTERAIREGVIPRWIDPWEAAGIFVGSATGIILLSMGGIQTVFSKEALESLVNKATWTLWMGLRAIKDQEQD